MFYSIICLLILHKNVHIFCLHQVILIGPERDGASEANQRVTFLLHCVQVTFFVAFFGGSYFFVEFLYSNQNDSGNN